MIEQLLKAAILDIENGEIERGIAYINHALQKIAKPVSLPVEPKPLIPKILPPEIKLTPLIGSVTVYTDGGYCPKSRIGAWAYTMKLPEGGVIEECKGVKGTTNNKMEMQAAIQVLKYFTEKKQKAKLIIYSDSTYLIKGITIWIKAWKRNKWNNGKVLNKDLWEELDYLNQLHNVEWKWVRGHSGNVGNERADMLATFAIEQTKAKFNFRHF